MRLAHLPPLPLLLLPLLLLLMVLTCQQRLVYRQGRNSIHEHRQSWLLRPLAPLLALLLHLPLPFLL